MKCRILHETVGRLRVHVGQENKITLHQADILEYYLRSLDGVTEVTVYERTADAVILFHSDRSVIIAGLSRFHYDCEVAVPENSGRELNRQFEEKLVLTVLCRGLRQIFLPSPVRAVYAVFSSFRYILNGLRSLKEGRLKVEVLDALAITVSLLRGDFSTASSVMFLLKIGDILQEWTRKKSVGDLARAMSLHVDQVWLKTTGQELLVPVSDIRAGDQIVIRMGGMIPLDGKVIQGECMVNQSAMTGESLPVRKTPGSYVYAGTVVEEGSCVICVENAAGKGRYDRIVKMIEESDKLKSATEDKASRLADNLVPYSLAGTALTWILTRNVTKAVSVLMVDFSCALKLSIPLAVLSAMKESNLHHISVKGGKFMEAISEADTIVFDKTGTMTHATPKVARVVPFRGEDADEMLRLAACLEEHYPHSMANAVVNAAREKGLDHEEKHSQVEYVVAHGISSMVDGEKIVIGSHHFVFDDEGCTVPAGEQEKFDSLPDEYSHLYMAVSGVLSAVICIEDPIRAEAPAVIHSLKQLGISKTVMMTGDSERTARTVAAQVGVDQYFSEVLPEDKAGFIRQEHEAGRKVIMVGDGVNDSPALSEADVGIAVLEGAAIAREIADITIPGDDLYAIMTLKILSDRLMARIHTSYRRIISFNSLLILLGVTGILSPAASAVLHNSSTVLISLENTTSLLDQDSTL